MTPQTNQPDSQSSLVDGFKGLNRDHDFARRPKERAALNWFERVRQILSKPSVSHRLAICVPTDGHPTPGFAFSLAQFFLALRQQPPILRGWDIALVMGDGSVIHDNREKLADRAIAMAATHILYLDDDMTFASEAVLSLLNRNAPFVACNYPRRKPPHVGVASREDLTGLIVTTPESTGMEPAHGAGFGMALITREVFAAIPKPWFLPVWDAADAMYHSEDVMFCRRARAAGFPLRIDQDASRLLGHCSEQVLTCEHMQAVSAFDSIMVPEAPPRG